MTQELSLKVWGSLACFTRPENKVERVSYDVLTASAARGVLESIYWKPEFQWQIDEIHVLNPIRRVSVKRNEVDKVMSILPVVNAYKSKGAKSNVQTYTPSHLDIGDSNSRTQRNTIFLKDVAYIIRAHMVKVRGTEPIRKHEEIFLRRVGRGSCLHQPYLGTRECSADFDFPDGTEEPIAVTRDLGWMLHDLYFTGDGQAIPLFCHYKMNDGVILLPERQVNYSVYEQGARK